MVSRRRPLLQPEPAIPLPADLHSLSAHSRRLPLPARRFGFDPLVRAQSFTICLLIVKRA
jgi:hypothetical protein